jgi:hypothetical protein
MPVENLLEHVGTEPFPEFHPPLLMAGETEITAITVNQGIRSTRAVAQSDFAQQAGSSLKSG